MLGSVARQNGPIASESIALPTWQTGCSNGGGQGKPYRSPHFSLLRNASKKPLPPRRTSFTVYSER
jgi:hypothetical protein